MNASISWFVLCRFEASTNCVEVSVKAGFLHIPTEDPKTHKIGRFWGCFRPHEDGTSDFWLVLTPFFFLLALKGHFRPYNRTEYDRN